MANGGDTITYTFSGSKITEDISAVDEIEIDYMDGAGGGKVFSQEGGSGGQVKNATVDVSSYSTLEIWVGGRGRGYQTSHPGGFGRSDGGKNQIAYIYECGSGGGSTELWTNSNSTFIAAADAGGGGGHAYSSYAGDYEAGGGGGARGGVGGAPNGYDAEGTGYGGDGGDGSMGALESGKNGGGELGIASGGTITNGGGSPSKTSGEIKLSFKSDLKPPDPPSNLSAEVQ